MNNFPDPNGSSEKETDEETSENYSYFTGGYVPAPVIPQRRKDKRIHRRAFLIGGGIIATAAIGGGAYFAGSIVRKILSPNNSQAPIALTFSYTGHSDDVNEVAWSPDGTRIASCANDGTVQVWNAFDGSNVVENKLNGVGVTALSWSPDGQYIAFIGDDGVTWDNCEVHVWNINGGDAMIDKKILAGGVKWSPDAKKIAFFCAPNGVSHASEVDVLNANNGNILLTYEQHIDGWTPVDAIAWSPDSGRIVSAGLDVEIWNANDGSTLFRYNPPPLYANTSGTAAVVAWSRDGGKIATGYNDIPLEGIPTVQVWNANDGSNIFVYKGHSAWIESVAWSPDGKHIASCAHDGTVQIWNALDGSNAVTYQVEGANSVAWSPDGKHLAVGCNGGIVEVWAAPK